MGLLKMFPSELNKFVVVGGSAEIHADFDDTGKIDSSDTERSKRYFRPGAIILPNLNLSAGLPSGVPGVDLSKERDADDEKIQGDKDFMEMAEFMVRSPTAGTLRADTLRLHVRSEDLKRCRVFLQSLDTPDTWNATLGAGAGNDCALSFPANPSWGLKFSAEALTLAGSPKAPGATGATPNKPLPPPAKFDKKGAGVTRGKKEPAYKKTGPGEIWVELVHEKAGKPKPKPMANNYDTVLFLIAPFLLQSNLEPCERVYVVYMKDGTDHPLNHDFVYDLTEGCWAAFGVSAGFTRRPELEFTPSAPGDLGKNHVTKAGEEALSPGRLYLVDGEEYGMDQWIQDQFEMGYCSAPGGLALNIAFHCRRAGDLGKFVNHEVANVDIGLFNDIEGTRQDTTDFGGNIEVSSPVSVKTSKQRKGNAGPAVRKHPKAPFGKIILGDCKNSARAGEGVVHDHTRQVLAAQTIQPIIPINTSWLHVAHVDEFMSFVPANSPRGSALLIASVSMMERLVAEIKKVDIKDGRTNFHRGKFGQYRAMINESAAGLAIDPADWQTYAEISAEDLFKSGHRAYSKRIHKRFMIPIEKRLKKCTDHKDRDVIKIPLYFKESDDPSKKFGSAENLTVAETVGMVNLQVVNGHLMVPMPFGPRMRKADAVKIVGSVLKGKVTVKSLPDNGFPFWAWPGLSMARVAQFFAHPASPVEREEIIEKIKDQSNTLSASLKTLVGTKQTEIEKANPGIPLDGAGVFTNWKRLFIPENSVDVIETYMLSVLGRIGCTVHFVDDWYYHEGFGEVHCGTNAKRTPPDELTLSQTWWEVYDPSVDTSYDPAG